MFRHILAIAAIIAVVMLLSHWLTGGQQEIVDRTYDPNRISEISGR